MANHPLNAISNRPATRRPVASDPRYEIVFERKAPRGRTLAKVIVALKALAERGGSAAGDVYAVAAGAVLNRTERLEDLNAERRFRRRLASGHAREPDLTSRPSKSSPPKVKL